MELAPRTIVNEVTSLAISRNSKYIAVGAMNGKLEIWDLKSRKEAYSLDYNPCSIIKYIKFSNDNNYLMILNEITLEIWDLTINKKKFAILNTKYSKLFAVSINMDLVSVLRRTRIWRCGTHSKR